MGTPKDLTLGHCSSESQAVHSTNNGYHNDHRGSSTNSAAQDRLRILKEERRKVEGFKRELPLCIQLLDDAINAAEVKLAHGKDVVLPIALRLSSSPETENGGVLSPESGRPSLGEFIPLKRLARDDQSSDTSGDGDGEGAEDYRETKCKQPPWMAEARLWNQTSSRSTDFVRSERTRGAGHSEQEQGSVTSSQQQQQVTGAGSFLPFQPRNVMPVVSRPRPRSGGFCADLNLSVHGERPATMLRLASDVEVGSTEAAAAAAVAAVAQQTPDEQTSKAMGLGSISSSGGGVGGGISSCSTRKTRRCWSPELHSSFISALHQLGGPHIATPKQLRELMKVDGLTNDEVKSHLQKYRLHSRRPSCSSPHESATATRAIAPQLVVVGSIWIPPQHAASAAAANSQAGSQSGVSDPSQFCHSTPLPLDYFATCINNGTPASAGAAPLEMLQLHRQPVFKSPQAAGTSQSQTSPQGPLQVTSQLSGATQASSTDTYETGEEEARSQSTSWNSGQQCGGQFMTVEPSPRGEPAELEMLDLKVHEHGNVVHAQSVGTSG